MTQVRGPLCVRHEWSDRVNEAGGLHSGACHALTRVLQRSAHRCEGVHAVCRVVCLLHLVAGLAVLLQTLPRLTVRACVRARVRARNCKRWCSGLA